MHNKKILVISTQLVGGCFQYSNSIIKNWKGNLEIVLPRKGREEDDVIPDWSIKYVEYNRVVRLFSFLQSLAKIGIGLLNKKYDALFLFGITKWDYYYLKLWKLSKLKSFTVIHDGKMHDGEVCEKFQNNMIEIMNTSTHLIFLSEYVHSLVKEQFNINKPFHIAPHGLINYGTIQNHEQRVKPIVLFLGRVTKYKGIDTLLDAIHHVSPDCYLKLIIAGRWDNNMEVVSSTDKIEIVNKYLSNDEILSYIEISDIMVFPYHEATQSGVATLAINYLKPSIVTNVGALNEQFTDKSAVFIQPDNPVLLANAIHELCENLTKREEMVEAIKQERNKFEWSSIAKDLEMYIAQELQK